MGVEMNVQPDTAQELLLAAAKRQDEGAVIALIERCQRQIVMAIEIAGVSRYSADYDDAQNLALFEIWKQFPNLRTDAAVCAWMHGIARRSTSSQVIRPAVRHRNREQRHRDHVPPNSLKSSGLSSEVAERDRLGRVLEELTEEHREILVLRYVQGHSEAEVAERLGIPVKTVSSRATRAKKAAVTVLKKMEVER